MEKKSVPITMQIPKESLEEIYRQCQKINNPNVGYNFNQLDMAHDALCRCKDAAGTIVHIVNDVRTGKKDN